MLYECLIIDFCCTVQIDHYQHPGRNDFAPGGKRPGGNDLLRNGPRPGPGHVRLLPRIAQFQPGMNQTIALIENGVEAELLADAQHAMVVRQDHGADAPYLLVAADGEEPAEQLRREELRLPARIIAAPLRRA
jgi:hypothetical protein